MLRHNQDMNKNTFMYGYINATTHFYGKFVRNKKILAYRLLIMYF